MESIYYVMSWLCHRNCQHCYEERFRPYHDEELERVVAEARSNFPRIVANLPGRLTYLDLSDPDDCGGFREKIGRVILAGGEILLDPIRETVLYHAITLLREKYRAQGGVKIVVQTTGDVLSRRILHELLDLGVWMVSISGMDAYHQGLETEQARDALRGKLTAMFESSGMQAFDTDRDSWGGGVESGPWYHFFGATPESWIGKLWPRGRAHANELSQAGIADNFCNAWSGGLNFLRTSHSGSEVSIEPNGNVYPCCIKTRQPVGSLLDAPLDEILQSLTGNPVYEAISSGHPERMGIQRGWTEERFLAASTTRLPSGRIYRNLCVGCDRFHEQVLSGCKTSLVSITNRL
jgi:hypothetical protein